MNPLTPLSALEQTFNYLASADWLLVLLSVSAFSLFVIASCVFIEIFGEGQFGVAWRKFKRPALRLLPDWKRVLRKAWSIRLIGVAALLTGAEAVLSAFGTDWIPVPVWGRMALIFVVMMGAFAFRLVAQNDTQEGK